MTESHKGRSGLAFQISARQQASAYGVIVKSHVQTLRIAWFTPPWWMMTALFDHRLPAISFIALRSGITAHQPMCQLAGLLNQIDDLFSLPRVNRYFERLLASGRPEKGDSQIAIYV